MAELPAIPGVLRADLIFTDGTDTDVQSRLFFQYEPAEMLTQDAATTFADNMYALVAGQLALWHPDVTFTEARITDLYSDTAPIGISTGVADGSRSGGPLPAGVATCVSFSIARRYRGGRPRNYLPWGTSTDLATPNAWTDGYISDVETAITHITSTFSGDSADGTTIGPHVNVSYYQGFTVNGAPATVRPKVRSSPRATPVVGTITDNVVVPYPGSQRRRNRK